MALGAVVTAVLAMLRASVTLTTYVGARVYPNDNGDAPSGAAKPYVQVESANETPMNTMGGSPSLSKWGSEVRLNIRVVSQSSSDSQANAISSAVKQALDGQSITVTGYGSACIEYQSLQPLRDAKAGCLPTREWVNSYLVTVHQ